MWPWSSVRLPVYVTSSRSWLTCFAASPVPLRNTTLPHLRDGFSRNLVARLKLPHVASTMSEADAEASTTNLALLKGYFPARALPKGAVLELYYSHRKQAVQFQTRVSPIHCAAMHHCVSFFSANTDMFGSRAAHRRNRTHRRRQRSWARCRTAHSPSSCYCPTSATVSKSQQNCERASHLAWLASRAAARSHRVSCHCT